MSAQQTLSCRCANKRNFQTLMRSNSWNMIIWWLNCGPNNFCYAPAPPLLYYILSLFLFTIKMHMLHLCPAAASFPRALFVIPVPLETSTIVPFLLRPFFFLPTSPPHLYFDAYVLFIHSSQIRSQEIRDICCTHFEDASCCSITCRAKVLFAFSGIGSAWLTGGGRPRARCLINKIFYVNSIKERERWDRWYIGLFGIRIRRGLRRWTYPWIRNNLCSCIRISYIKYLHL